MQYGLIGEHLGHSYSKEIHAAFADYEYTLCEIAPDDLENFCKNRDFCGINVTIPYKKDIIPFLDEIDSAAEKIGAVNTVVNKNGRLYGYNTDFYGMKALIEDSGIKLKDKKVLVLGTGGTSLTAMSVCADLGAGEIIRVSRRAGEGVCDYKAAQTIHRDAEIIINTTPCGMYPNTEDTPIDISIFKNLKAVFDAIYNPLKSRLVLAAEGRNIIAAGGLYMLAAQAVYAGGLFLDRPINPADIQKTYKAVLNSKRNIVLIGMPASGKSTVGRELSKKLNRPFVDSDSVITEKIGMSISEFFKLNGEVKFREIETEVIAELSEKSGLIIATGGGAVLKGENVSALKANGALVFLDRPLEGLASTADRPLSSSRADTERLYNERYDIYCSAADVRINADGSISQVTERLLNDENFSFKRP